MNSKQSSPWTEISGHIYDIECEFLYTLAKNKLVLEIGTHHGKSTSALAASATSVTSIDSYEGDPQINAPVYEVTKNNLKQFNNVSLLIGRWQEQNINYSDYDLIFYDGCHTEEREFLSALTNHISVLIFHDYKPYELGMRHVVESLIEYNERSLRRLLRGPGSLAWFDKVE